MIKVADIILSNENCAPHKFSLSGTDSSRFIIYDKKLYFKINSSDNSFDSSYNRISSDGDLITGKTYSVTVSIQDLANKLPSIQKNFSLTINCDYFW